MPAGLFQTNTIEVVVSISLRKWECRFIAGKHDGVPLKSQEHVLLRVGGGNTQREESVAWAGEFVRRAVVEIRCGGNFIPKRPRAVSSLFVLSTRNGVYGDTSVCGAADARTHGCRISTASYYTNRRRLRDENLVMSLVGGY